MARLLFRRWGFASPRVPRAQTEGAQTEGAQTEGTPCRMAHASTDVLTDCGLIGGYRRVGTGAPGKGTLVGAGPLGLKKRLMATVLR